MTNRSMPSISQVAKEIENYKKDCKDWHSKEECPLRNCCKCGLKMDRICDRCLMAQRRADGWRSPEDWQKAIDEFYQWKLEAKQKLKEKLSGEQETGYFDTTTKEVHDIIDEVFGK